MICLRNAESYNEAVLCKEDYEFRIFIIDGIESSSHGTSECISFIAVILAILKGAL